MKQPSFKKAMRLARLEKSLGGGVAPGGRPASRADVFEALWKDPKYLRLHDRKEKIGRQWNQEDARKNGPGGSPERAERLSKLFTAAIRRVGKYEDDALKKAGLQP